MKRYITTFALAASFALVGCMAADDTEGTDVARLSPAAEHLVSQFPPDMEVVVIDDYARDALPALVQVRLHNSLDIDMRKGVHFGDDWTVDPGPCGCDGPSCVESWVADNLGCDVCAVFVCGDNPVHACHSCD